MRVGHWAGVRRCNSPVGRRLQLWRSTLAAGRRRVAAAVQLASGSWADPLCSSQAAKHEATSETGRLQAGNENHKQRAKQLHTGPHQHPRNAELGIVQM